MFTLDAAGVGKRYGKRAALSGFDLQLEAGKIYGLLRPNGSGKTTGLHILTGLLAPDEGTVEILGIPVEDKASRRLYGFAPDDLPLPGALTGREYLAFHDAMHRRRDQDRSHELADILGLSGDLDKQVGHFSHGMKRKLQVVAALSHSPELVVLDEPFRGLDPDASAALRQILSSFAASGRSVLIATHDMLRAERDCDEVTILSEGRTVGRGSPQGLLAAHPECSSLEEVFMSITGLRRASAEREARISALSQRGRFS
ncbi:ABC transporter ATP-binding protein [Sinomonas sp. ASV322]|uniref:ABC transporter ATP-binding protein n=1 Tax=Sinomonas sp. ASV322 TaxID=3041920 RepID=UPI0027DBBD10|nr:ABC transporter ATP-binding protein [Sinomonas sp. ASV322]MDQ4502776.1 ABC transporter ATP-binding protein [Sinomonas sp. ASV322]